MAAECDDPEAFSISKLGVMPSDHQEPRQLPPMEVLEQARQGFNRLIGVTESDEVEFKSQPYQLKQNAQKHELHAFGEQEAQGRA